MKHGLILLPAIVAAVIHHSARADSDRLNIRKAAWQEVLEGEEFHFVQSDVGLVYLLSQFGGDCQVHMVYDPAKSWAMTFKFVRRGKAAVTIEGHTESVFRAEGDLVWFAHFPRSTSGCAVSAHDLSTGQEIWRTKLRAVGNPEHSKYENRVAIYLSRLTAVERGDEGVVVIVGHESYGDYKEVLDQKTGALLAHKTYRKGY
jgi:hypothetical protein